MINLYSHRYILDIALLIVLIKRKDYEFNEFYIDCFKKYLLVKNFECLKIDINLKYKKMTRTNR
jgi:hypothetical protein